MSFTLVAWYDNESLRAIKFMIAYAGRYQSHEEVSYEVPDCRGECKHSMTEECSQCLLPYVTDGQLKVRSEFWDLHRFVAGRLGLYPTGPDMVQAGFRVEEMIDDLRVSFENGIGTEDYTLEYRHRQRDLATKIDDWLTSREYLVDNTPTYLDFVLYQLMLCHMSMFPLFCDRDYGHLPNIDRFLKNIQSIPRVWNYLQTTDYGKFSPYVVNLFVRPKPGVL